MKPKNISRNTVTQQVADELLIYDLKRNKAFCLNKTAASVWESCDGIRTPGKIRRKLEKAFGVNLSDKFVLFSIVQLYKYGLIETDPAITLVSVGISRRLLLREIGKTTAIALPLIASVVSPRPAQAQSACLPQPSGCQCVNGYSSGQDCTGDTQFNNCGPGCRCIASPGFDDCLP